MKYQTFLKSLLFAAILVFLIMTLCLKLIGLSNIQVPLVQEDTVLNGHQAYLRGRQLVDGGVIQNWSDYREQAIWQVVCEEAQKVSVVIEGEAHKNNFPSAQLQLGDKVFELTFPVKPGTFTYAVAEYELPRGESTIILRGSANIPKKMKFCDIHAIHLIKEKKDSL
jgi:hypothetical protein